jgi:hypothetical protein
LITTNHSTLFSENAARLRQNGTTGNRQCSADVTLRKMRMSRADTHALLDMLREP